MVLLEVDAIRVSSLELERDAPRPVRMDRVAPRIEAFERMEVPAGNIHLLGVRGLIKGIELTQNPLMHPRIDLSGSALLEKIT